MVYLFRSEAALFSHSLSLLTAKKTQDDEPTMLPMRFHRARVIQAIATLSNHIMHQRLEGGDAEELNEMQTDLIYKMDEIMDTWEGVILGQVTVNEATHTKPSIKSPLETLSS